VGLFKNPLFRSGTRTRVVHAGSKLQVYGHRKVGDFITQLAILDQYFVTSPISEGSESPDTTEPVSISELVTDIKMCGEWQAR
jgi:hypothetical protein